MKTQDFSAFGWRIDRYEFDAGEQYTIGLKKDTPRDVLANRTYYVKGRATGVSDTPAYVPPARYPGFFYTDMPETIVAATTIYTAIEPLEWWCINWHQNNRAFPTTVKRVVASGEQFTLVAGAKLFLCSGSVSANGTLYTAPCEIAPAETTVFTATEDTYGLDFA